MIGLQSSRDNLVYQARNSFLRLDWLTVDPKASNRKFKPSKCRKSLGPCLFNMGHFQDSLPKKTESAAGIKSLPNQIRLSNVLLQFAAAALRSAYFFLTGAPVVELMEEEGPCRPSLQPAQQPVSCANLSCELRTSLILAERIPTEEFAMWIQSVSAS